MAALIYRAKTREIQRRALEHLGAISGSAIATNANLPIGTVNAVLKGRAPSTKVVLALCELFQCGEREIFDVVVEQDDDREPVTVF